MSRPRPVARASISDASVAVASMVPVMKSTIDSPNRVGGASGSPVTLRNPASACIR